MTKLLKNCKTCKKEFYVNKCRENTAKFCSLSCSGKAQKPWNKGLKGCINAGSFKKESIPWNKNLKGWWTEKLYEDRKKRRGKHFSLNTEFKKGSKSPNWQKGYHISKNGYKIINEKGKQFFEHHRVWCLANSMPVVPQGCVIHHINQNKIDNHAENLILLPIGTHAWLHHQLRKTKEAVIA